MATVAVESSEKLPTHLDLPETDGLPVDNTYQPTQWCLFRDSIRPHLDRLHPDGQYLAATDLGIYYQRTSQPLKGCRCPDFTYVPNVPPIPSDYPYRRSYVMWQERAAPVLVIELVSDESRGTEHDRTPETGKFWIYEQKIKAAYYAIYDPDTAQIELFHLKNGQYEEVDSDDDGLYPIPEMRLKLGTYYETQDAMTLNWLRFFTEDGLLLPLQAEIEAQRADREQQRAEQARKRLTEQRQATEKEKERADRETERADKETERADEEKHRADRLAAKLLELGIDPKLL